MKSESYTVELKPPTISGALPKTFNIQSANRTGALGEALDLAAKVTRETGIEYRVVRVS